MNNIGFLYSDKRNEIDHTFTAYKNDNFLDIESVKEFNKNLLKNYDEELVNTGLFFIDYIHKLSMTIGTIYYDDGIQIARELEENGEEEEENEEERKEPVINTEKTFKYDECVICLTNPPTVLFL